MKTQKLKKIKEAGILKGIRHRIELNALTAIFFLVIQIFSQAPAAFASELTMGPATGAPILVKEFDPNAKIPKTPSVAPDKAVPSLALDNLLSQENEVLSEVQSKVEEKRAGSKNHRSQGEIRDLPEYSFDEALDYLTPDYAAAVIVKSLAAKDLRQLTELKIEVGIAVIHGKIVLFTSGDKSEIRTLPAAQELLEKASLMAHVHSQGERVQPSLTDIQEADERVEYVVSEEGVYAYNHNGLKNEYPRDYGWFSRKIAALQNKAASSKQARDVLNSFIKSMDDYNRDKEASVLLRSGDPNTVLPGQPV